MHVEICTQYAHVASRLNVSTIMRANGTRQQMDTNTLSMLHVSDRLDFLKSHCVFVHHNRWHRPKIDGYESVANDISKMETKLTFNKQCRVGIVAEYNILLKS